MTIPEAQEPALLRPRRERRRWTAGRVIGTVVATLLVVSAASIGAWMLTHQQRVADQLAVWNFEPDAVIAGYADRSSMTDEGRFLFYASRPEVASDPEFDEQCSTEVEGVGILGCYQHPARLIYLFDVTDDRLEGIEEVVAAHEMLHAAWDRMADDEREHLGELLEVEAAKLADDPEFAETLAFYAKAEPTERQNELHSIVGTEFVEISPELEAHYAIYFRDRASLVDLHIASHAVFEQQQAAIDGIVAQLESIKASVDTDYASYNAGYDVLNADIADFNERAEAGEFDSQAQFDRERDALIARQAELDGLFASITDRKTQYEDLIAQLDDLNAQVAELNESINVEPRDEDGL